MNDSTQKSMRQPIEWAMETDVDPFFMLSNWLVRDALENKSDAVTALTSAETTLDEFRTLKRVFKQLRVQGETVSDRRLGARLYAISIASAFVFHDRIITTQSSERLIRAFTDLRTDTQLPGPLHAVAERALERMTRES
jgi:cell fate (sporulation/competence/biofilm development) regulator YlbF (YheA/YmcA/DUF963 family)